MFFGSFSVFLWTAIITARFFRKSPPPKPSDRMPPLDRLNAKPRILGGPNASRMCQEQVEKPHGQEAPPETKSQDRCCIISGCVRQHACTRGPAFGFGDCRCSNLYQHEAVCTYVLWIFQLFYLDGHHHSAFYYKSLPPKPSDRMPPLDGLNAKPRVLGGAKCQLNVPGAS